MSSSLLSRSSVDTWTIETRQPDRTEATSIPTQAECAAQPYDLVMGTLVNAATVDDAAGIAHVNVASWRQAYAHLLSPGFLARISEQDIANGFRRALELGRTVWVARVDDQIVGFAVAREPREENPPRDLELGLIYVLPGNHGSGLAQPLLDAAIGTAPCMLWVASDNPRAHAFYRRNGFSFDGATKIEDQWENMQTSRMIR